MVDIDSSELAEKLMHELITRRKSLGYSQYKIADRSDLHFRTVNYMENRAGGGRTQLRSIIEYAASVGLRLELRDAWKGKRTKSQIAKAEQAAQRAPSPEASATF